MSTFNELVVSAESPDGFVTAFLRVMPMVPKDTRRRLKHIMMTITMQHGDHVLFNRFNGHSVAQILEDSKDIAEAQPIASGEVDGFRYEVFEKPSSEEANGSDPPGNSSSS